MDFCCKKKDFDSLLAEQSLPGWYFRNEIKSGGRDETIRIYKHLLLRSDDGIQGFDFSIDAPEWEGGWDSGKLRLGVYEDYWGSRQRVVRLAKEQISEITLRKLNKIKGLVRKYQNVEIGDQREAEKYEKEELLIRRFYRDFMQANPQGEATEEQYLCFVRDWEKKHGRTGLVE